MTTTSDAEPAAVSTEGADSSAGSKPAATPGAELVASTSGADHVATAGVPPNDQVNEEMEPVSESFVESYRRDLLADLTVSVGDPELAKTVKDAANQDLDETLDDAQARFDRLSATNRLVRKLPVVVAAGQRSLGPAGS
jgi:hypothetical protein